MRSWISKTLESLFSTRREHNISHSNLEIMLRTEFDAKTLEWNGRVIESDAGGIDQSLGQAILNSLEVNGPRVAQICANTGRTKTFEEIRTLTINAMKSLRAFGWEDGDLICFSTTNTTDVVPITFAALCMGVQVAVLPEFLMHMEFERFLNLLKPKVFLCDVDIYRKCSEYLRKNNVTIFTFDDTIDDTYSTNILLEPVAATDAHLKPVHVNASTHSAFILTTSGTSGKSKCVRLSHASILHKVNSLKCIFGRSDIVLAYTRFYGVSGIRSLFGSTLHGSTRIVNQYPFSTKRYFEIVDKFKVSVSIGSARLPVDLLHNPDIESADLSSLNVFCTGGTKIFHSIIQDMSKHMPRGRYCHTYGMTETASTIAMNFRHIKNDCVGQLISGYKAKIVNEAGERLGIDEIGEICVKLPYPMLGYISDDHDNVDNVMDSEGFLMTGDLGKFDGADDLFIVDRKKEVFKYFGDYVVPSEIEEQLNTIDGVKESCVVPIPDKNFNCLPASLIVKTPDSECSEQSISEWMVNNSSFCNELRGGVYFVDKLPINARGKMDRNLVKTMAIELFKKSKS